MISSILYTTTIYFGNIMAGKNPNIVMTIINTNGVISQISHIQENVLLLFVIDFPGSGETGGILKVHLCVREGGSFSLKETYTSAISNLVAGDTEGLDSFILFYPFD